MKPYVIVSPEYDHTSGGIKVMWGLYGHLLARGYEVYMNCYPHTDVIAVYPEIYSGNPVGAKTVVRYILNKLGVMHGGVEPLKELDTNEHNYYFSRLFGNTDMYHYMFLPVINLEIFKDQKRIRNKSAVFFGKGRDGNVHKPSTIIDRSTAVDQQDLADFLNECEVLYTYDPVSAMTEIARLCGTRVVYLAEGYTREDYERYEPGVNGMSFGSDTGEVLDVDAFRAHYIDLGRHFSWRLDTFISETQGGK